MDSEIIQKRKTRVFKSFVKLEVMHQEYPKIQSFIKDFRAFL